MRYSRWLIIIAIFPYAATQSQYDSSGNEAYISMQHVYGATAGLVYSATRQIATTYASRATKAYITNKVSYQDNPANQRHMYLAPQAVKQELAECPFARAIYGIFTAIGAPITTKLIHTTSRYSMDRDTYHDFFHGWRIGSILGSLATCCYIRAWQHPRMHTEAGIVALSLCISYDDAHGWHVSSPITG